MSRDDTRHCRKVGEKMTELKNVIREHKKTVLVLAVFLLLSLGLAVRDKLDMPLDSAEVTRQEEGGSAESRTFSYQIDGEEPREITLEINPVEPSGEEAEELLEQAVTEWESVYLNENESENKICTALNLPDRFCEGAVTASYENSDYDILDMDGGILLDNVPEEGALVELTVEFSYAGYTRRESRWLKIVLPERGSPEWLALQTKRDIVETEENTREEETFFLPAEVDGHRITWERQEDAQWIYFIFLGVVAAFCLEWRTREAQRKAEKERKDQLMLEYPQMVEQLSLLLGSGMTVRGAWERMLLTEQKMRRETKQKMRLSIAEMWITYREITKGCGEREAYERFGSRIGLIPYRRFGAVLSQNLSKGTRDVQELLREEAREALEMRKNHARKLGEEAGMKLLFPMLLMFVLILLVLLVPAIQSFS